MTVTNTEFCFDAHYYSRAELKFVDTPVTLNSDETVLLLRGTSNIGYPGPLEWDKNSRYAPILAMFENGPRMRRIIDEQIVPLVSLARRAEIQIMYAMEGWDAVKRYPQWRAIADKVPEPEPYEWPGSPNTDWIAEHEERVFMPGYAKALAELNAVIDAAPVLPVQGDDWVISTYEQGHQLMCENGKWNILQTGFDTNFDVFYGAALGMQRSFWSFRSFLLRDCMTGLERHDTVEAETLGTTSANVMIEAMHCYGSTGKTVRSALREAIGD